MLGVLLFVLTLYMFIFYAYSAGGWVNECVYLCR